MAKKNCDIYGPDLSIHEGQGKAIADVGLQSMRGVGVTDRQEWSTGPDTSKNNLEKLK